MKELVEVIAKALVDDPDSVVVTEREERKTTVLEVRVADGGVIHPAVFYFFPC